MAWISFAECPGFLRFFFIVYLLNCFKLHNQYYHTYKENEINDDDATPQENDDQAENETE